MEEEKLVGTCGVGGWCIMVELLFDLLMLDQVLINEVIPATLQRSKEADGRMWPFRSPRSYDPENSHLYSPYMDYSLSFYSWKSYQCKLWLELKAFPQNRVWSTRYWFRRCLIYQSLHLFHNQIITGDQPLILCWIYSQGNFWAREEAT